MSLWSTQGIVRDLFPKETGARLVKVDGKDVSLLSLFEQQSVAIQDKFEDSLRRDLNYTDEASVVGMINSHILLICEASVNVPGVSTCRYVSGAIHVQIPNVDKQVKVNVDGYAKITIGGNKEGPPLIVEIKRDNANPSRLGLC